jgi:RimJ/RimL family protein N-acetyltransferase
MMLPSGASAHHRGDKLQVRDLEQEDVPLVNDYWAALTPSDHDRMSMNPDAIPMPYIDLAAHLGNAGLPCEARGYDILVWALNGRAAGMSTLRNIRFGKYGEIHLHLFQPELRGRGYGRRFLAMAVRECFRRFKLQIIVCEPSSANPGPNRLLQRLGLAVARTYRTVPGPLSREHEVNRYEITPALAAAFPES